MNERQLTVSAIALFADGFSHTQIADALGVDTDRAAELTATGADEQSTGTMGHGKFVLRRSMMWGMNFESFSSSRRRGGY